MLTQDQLKTALLYNPMTGIFVRKIKTSPRINIGDVAGSTSDGGYLLISVLGKQYRSHRLAWLYMTGKFPDLHIDHINHSRKDNRWANLREASRFDNATNRPLQSNNTSGVVGVFKHRVTRRWCAKIKVHGENIHLGYYSDINSAILTRKVAEFAYGFHANHGSKL